MAAIQTEIGYAPFTRWPQSLHPALGVSPRRIVEDACMAHETGKPIPFRKAKRKTGSASVRPRARVIRAVEVVVAGETVIPILQFRRQSSAA